MLEIGTSSTQRAVVHTVVGVMQSWSVEVSST